jgi:mRNA-degrading endonuclease RelE of RelBE toxin-antitoxin system
MGNFEYLPAFEKEFKKLAKRYRSLGDDLKTFEQVLQIFPTGQGKNFTILHGGETVKIVKARLACRTLKDRSLRIVYAFQGKNVTFLYLEIYFKGDKENENTERLAEYLRSIKQ